MLETSSLKSGGGTGGGGYPDDTAYLGRFSRGPGRVRCKWLQLSRLSPDPQCGYGATLCEAHLKRSMASRHTVSILVVRWRLQRCKGLSPTAARNRCTKYCGENHHLMAHQVGSAKQCSVHNTQTSHCGRTPLQEHSAARRGCRPDAAPCRPDAASGVRRPDQGGGRPGSDRPGSPAD